MAIHAAAVTIARSRIADTVPYAYAAIRTRTAGDHRGLRRLRLHLSRAGIRSSRFDRDVFVPAIGGLRSRLRFLQRVGVGGPRAQRSDDVQGSHARGNARE